jgi:hypothetical protein
VQSDRIYYCLVKAADIKQKATSGHLVLSCGSMAWMAAKKEKKKVTPFIALAFAKRQILGVQSRLFSLMHCVGSLHISPISILRMKTAADWLRDHPLLSFESSASLLTVQWLIRN